ncbi:hypothetical protein PGN35_006280 [Nodosilinea sp. PGN35]|uniref:hypothetical protein n=1 Tax=Nodosilinea sp. PGN35 TaxID=3020489 RepID=UPI0023B34F70|nr:hypothetical protein [Nodosilinea sp. TSF1-S3]MDF0367725.1 hypothetical protein [Nodosilinea sp. TSF1-S3]
MTSTLATAFGFNSAPLTAIGVGRGRRSAAHPRKTQPSQARPGFASGGWRPIFCWFRLNRLALTLGLGLLLVGVGGCVNLSAVAPRQIVIKQAWEIESGDRVAGQLVTGSLGDISIRLQGARLRAPFTGQVELAAKGFNCIYFSSPEVPAYLFRYCGVSQPHLGPVQAGSVMGRGRYIHFATLRRQPDGTWAIVEPSDRVLERSLNRPPSGFSF